MRKILFVLLYFFFINAFSQTKESDIITGKSYFIKSKILNEEREIQVSLPEDYAFSNKRYPVLYILDGQRLFLLGVSVHQSLMKFEQSPDFIVVGISNKYPQRFGHFSSRAKVFLNFIEDDVIRFIDHKFRTTNERLLFGWEYAGGFTIQTMILNPDLFSAYIASSPFPLNAPDLAIKDKRLKQMDSLLNSKSEFDKSFYFTVGTDEGVVKAGTDDLSELLSKKKLSNFNWQYRIINGEEHTSTPFSTLYQALRKHYQYYSILQFKNLNEFLKAGGIPYVFDYYQKRANQYGFSPEVSRWTKFTIIRNAMRANDYSHFNTFMKEFGSKDFMEQLRTSRSSSIAEFYLKHQKDTKALELFTFLYQKHPDSQRIVKGLGDTYKALRDNQKAEFYYKKLDELKNK